MTSRPTTPSTRRYRLVGADGRPYRSSTHGRLGGHRRSHIYGRLDCPSALRWLARGHYAAHRVFFADEATARAAGYRPCAVCLPQPYREWKARRCNPAHLDGVPPTAHRGAWPGPVTGDDRGRARRITMTVTAPATTTTPVGPAEVEVPALDRLDWADLAAALDSNGFAMTEALLSPEQCRQMIEVFDDDAAFRSTVDMARLSFGEGRYRYFADPLPPLVQTLRARMYPHLAEIANRWAGLLGEDTFPTEHAGLVEACAAAGQHKPTPLVLRYGPTGYNCLHQDVYGELTFPLQVLFMLDTPEVDFTGGESVFVEQRPRQQSRPMVARPGLGQAVVFPVRHRPKQGARGYHRVQMRHGVSAVHTGDRHVLGVIFHNAR